MMKYSCPPWKEVAQYFQIGALFVLWYVFGSVAVIYAKLFLLCGDAITLTLSQYLVGFFCSYLWIFSFQKGEGGTANPSSSILDIIETNKEISYAMWALVISNGIGHYLTNASMGAVNASLTHTIKASEPFFVACWSALILSSPPTPLMVLAFFPIFGGVYLVCSSDLSFTMAGFMLAIGSNVLFSLRNVVFKKITKGTAIAIYGLLCLTGVACMLVVGVFALSINNTFYFSPPCPADVSSNHFLDLFLASLFHFCYNAISFQILTVVSSITHSIGNAMRRVVIIVSSLIFFGLGLDLEIVGGVLIAALGCLLYSFATISVNKEKAERKTESV